MDKVEGEGEPVRAPYSVGPKMHVPASSSYLESAKLGNYQELKNRMAYNVQHIRTYRHPTLEVWRDEEPFSSSGSMIAQPLRISFR